MSLLKMLDSALKFAGIASNNVLVGRGMADNSASVAEEHIRSDKDVSKEAIAGYRAGLDKAATPEERQAIFNRIEAEASAHREAAAKASSQNKSMQERALKLGVLVSAGICVVVAAGVGVYFRLAPPVEPT